MISVNATLDAELDSLLRRPATAFTARRFMPVWTQEIAAGATQYAMGHSACTDEDGLILFRARSNAGTLGIGIK